MRQSHILCYSWLFSALFHFRCVSARKADEFYTFKEATATSTFVAANDDTQKFGAARAYQLGSSYWCSAGNHYATDFVSWTGELWDRAKISQLEIFWEYAPKEVEISVSTTGDSFTVVVPFRETFENKPSYRERFKLDTPHEAKFVRLTLRGSINEYFGIREIHVFGSGDPLFMIKSGISSPDGEMCLQLESGQHDDATRVILDLCTHAIAAADGRELWRQDSRHRIVSAVAHPPKCLTSVEPSKYGAVVIDDCEVNDDEICRWDFSGNSQLSLKGGNELCLTQADEYSGVAGMGNLLQILRSKVKISSSNSNAKHEATFAVDDSLKTYWASLLFPDSNAHNTDITIDFGQLVHASQIVIDWEYQPLSYIVECSEDNNVFKLLAKNLSNSSNVTIDSFAGHDLRQLRIVMLQPHYSFGKVSGGFLYGIRDIKVLSSNLKTVIGDCRAAANSSDARDKYFVSYVDSFEPGLANRIKSMENGLHDNINEVMKEISNLNELLEGTAVCMDKKKGCDDKLNEMTKAEMYLWKQIQALKCDKMDTSYSFKTLLGENMNNPAEDCYVIKAKNHSATSGFYWIEPKCAKHPLRVYCDMKSQTSMYIWNGKDIMPSNQSIHSLKSPSSIRYQCGAYGLEPLIVKSKHQIEGLKVALHLMNFEKKSQSFIPLAYKFSASGVFKDLMNIFSFMTDPHSLDLDMAAYDIEKGANSSTYVINPGLEHNSAGLSMETGEIESFDLETVDVAAIVCSTNTTVENANPIELACNDRFGKSEKLSGSLNTNIIVRCGEDCSDREELPVYGTDCLYSEHSSICRAAIHCGVIASKGTFTISIESGLRFYNGSNQNGIQSIAYNKTWQGLKDLVPKNPEEASEPERNGPECKYSIRILLLEKVCPIVETHGSFLQLHEPNTSYGHSQSHGTNSTQYVPNSTSISNGIDLKQQNGKYESEGSHNNPDEVGLIQTDPKTKEEVIKIMHEIDSLYGVDSRTVGKAIENVAAVVSRAKKYLKPLESISNRQERILSLLFDRTEMVTERCDDLKSDSESDRIRFENLLKGELERSVERSDKIKPDYTKMPFSKMFKIYDTGMAYGGPSSWGYSDSPFEGHNSYIVQSSGIDSARKAEGTFAFLRHHLYFDFDMNIDLAAKCEGSIGVTFRVHDQFNYYLFVMNFHDSNKQLLKVQDGVVSVLSTNPDEGYVKNKWTHIHISASHFSIEVSCDGQLILRVLDTAFLHGGVGLYCRGSSGSFYFDNLIVEPRKLISLESSHRADMLKSMDCCTFTETFTGNFSSCYRVINPQHSHSISWAFKELFGGKHRAIHQQNSSSDNLGIGSLAILKDERFCTIGGFRLRVLPQCEGGTVGAVLRYLDERNMILVELSMKELRIRHINNGESDVLSSIPASFSVGKWNSMEILMTKSEIRVKVKNNVDHGSFLTNWLLSTDSEVKANTEKLNNVGWDMGLKASACNSSYFDSIQILPTSKKGSLPLPDFVRFSTNKAWKPCITNIHILTRVSLCKKMHRNRSDASLCLEHFCSACCSYHTKLLGEEQERGCSEMCQKNDKLVKYHLDNFLSYVGDCTTLKGDGFDHCNGERDCLRESCRLCCASGNFRGLQDEKITSLEISSCQNQCLSIL